MRFVLAVAGIALAVVALQAWYRRWRDQQPDPALDDPRWKITPLTKERYLYLNADETLAVKTGQRRGAASAIRARAARVETGEPVRDVLRMAKR